MAFKFRSSEPLELDITPMIDCVFQLILFFMVIISIAVIVGIAIRFPEAQADKKDRAEQSKEKTLFAFIGRDETDGDHDIRQHGPIKLCSKDFLIRAYPDTAGQNAETNRVFEEIRKELNSLIEQGYKKDQIVITGDVTAYHWKIVKMIDVAKKCDVRGFSLTPPK